MMCVVCVSVQRGNSGDGCDLASTLSKYNLWKDDLFVLSWARIQQTENTTSMTSLTQTHNILQHSKAKTHFHNGRYTTIFPTDPHTVTTTDIKTSMCHIHTSIVTRHLSSRGNDKTLCTPLPHIRSSEEILPRLTRRTLAQLRTNKQLSNHTYKKSTPNHFHHHYPPPFVTLTYTTHIISSTAPTFSPLDFWTDHAGVTALVVRWTDKLDPLARVNGVGIQQQQEINRVERTYTIDGTYTVERSYTTHS